MADMMTGLMLVFLLIAILFISQTQGRVQQYRAVKADILQELRSAFQEKEDEWQIEIKDDLTIVFNNPKTLFEQDSAIITAAYKEILNEFIPIYVRIINQDKYRGRVTEVRIEGHTADFSPTYDTYIDTVELSQDRAREILRYIRSNQYYVSLDEGSKKKLEFWFTANGYGLGRALDSAGELVYFSKRYDDISSNSRRVEFRIVTDSETLVDEIFNSIK